MNNPKPGTKAFKCVFYIQIINGSTIEAELAYSFITTPDTTYAEFEKHRADTAALLDAALPVGYRVALFDKSTVTRYEPELDGD